MSPSLSAPRLSAGAIVYHWKGREPRYLLLRAFRHWDFPKGVVEPGEEPFAAARREVFEETGIRTLRFPWNEEFRETAPYGRGKIARYYLAETPTSNVTLGINPELGKPEHQEFRWVAAEEARQLLPPRLSPIFEWAHDRITGGSV
ncbi:bis(5'-nucleosyl)-tetraphosphatase [Methylacidimicrobium sp. B4]|uniref:bis(5'-nucleosyl)-tetraphosphatase n=1 Tax=Methylacidimicrobium sp. B4 TaxID=2796139 RepID=UPI001A8F8B56|nr:bis(5'-nucleosyl)-tetraphosphatase [Methylacidimicrobium sp. B4]QSR84528.1 NUDIX domain-containing protein [Methylacidimicrobium sp. B4]